MKTECCEAIVLRSIEYKERQRIITLFTPTCGLISLIIKGITSKKPHLLSLTTPFSQAEFHFVRGKSDLFYFRDGSLIDEHLLLRSQWHHLDAGSKLLKALLRTQLPGKAAPALYQLSLTYLKQIPFFPHPAPLISSFFLKLLAHEGHLHIGQNCLICQAPASHLHRGETLCKTHVVHPSYYFNEDQWKILFILQNARSFSMIKDLPQDSLLMDQIAAYFDERIREC